VLAEDMAIPSGRDVLMVYLSTLKDSTLRTYERYLGMVTDLCMPRMETSKATPEEMKMRLLSFDWTQVDLLFVSRIHRLAQNQRHSRSTLSGLLVVCRGIANARWILKQITYDEYARIAEVGKRTRKRGKSEEKNRVIPFEDLIKMLQACLADEKRKLGMRDFALLSLLYGTGLRSQEAVNLRLNQIDFEQETITLVSNAGDERRVWAVNGVMTALRQWLEYHTPVDGVMFPAFAPVTHDRRLIVEQVLSRDIEEYAVRKRVGSCPRLSIIIRFAPEPDLTH
jgi:integrase/recombinase XerD